MKLTLDPQPMILALGKGPDSSGMMYPCLYDMNTHCYIDKVISMAPVFSVAHNVAECELRLIIDDILGFDSSPDPVRASMPVPGAGVVTLTARTLQWKAL